jgi:nitroimidazol reductase NimA-like FMN-containing flavoprotein (pyridoxamine 5'-phosphate oxidase superfamily)
MDEPVTERPAMRDYGVPDTPEGLLPWAWAEQRLRDSRSYWVVTSDTSGRPHAMPVWGVWRPADGFWFSCAPSARKARNLRANPQLVVAADSTVEVVSVEGSAREATGDEREPAIADYAAKYAAETGGTDLAAFLRDHSMFVMTPSRAFGVIEREDEFSARATRWRWPGQAAVSRPTG